MALPCRSELAGDILAELAETAMGVAGSDQTQARGECLGPRSRGCNQHNKWQGHTVVWLFQHVVLEQVSTHVENNLNPYLTSHHKQRLTQNGSKTRCKQ